MNSQIFKITFLNQLKYIWFFLIPPIFSLYYFISDFIGGGYGFSFNEVLNFICLTIFFLVVTLAIFTPFYVMHITYFNLDKKKIIEYDPYKMTWKITENGIISIFYTNDISKVINHWAGNLFSLRLIDTYNFSVFVLKNGKEYTITCLTLDFNKLRKLVPKNKIIETKHGIPLLSVK